MSQMGHRVLTAFDGREGFQIAQMARPDLLISDVALESGDSIEMCRLIRAHPLLRAMPVLLVSALPRDGETVSEALRAGADDYLHIPFEPESLATKVVQMIESKPKNETGLV